MRNACDKYTQRYLKKGVTGPITFAYSKRPDNFSESVSIGIVAQNQEPEINVVEMRGRTKEILPILSKLDGALSATIPAGYTYERYNFMRYTSIPISQRKEILKDSYLHRGVVRLSFSKDPNMPFDIRQIVIKDTYDDGRQKPLSLDLILSSSDKIVSFAKDMLSVADEITVQNFDYVDNNPSKDLIIESCLIRPVRNSKNNIVSWDYHVTSLNNQPLQASILPHLESIYEFMNIPATAIERFTVVKPQKHRRNTSIIHKN